MVLAIADTNTVWMLNNDIFPCRIRPTKTYRYAIRLEDVEAYLQKKRAERRMVCVDQMGNLLKPNCVTTRFPEVLKKYGLRPVRREDVLAYMAKSEREKRKEIPDGIINTKKTNNPRRTESQDSDCGGYFDDTHYKLRDKE